MSRRSVVFSVVCGGVLAALVYLHVLLNVRSTLIYHQQYPVFLTTLDYFKDFLARLGGGPLQYLSLLASQSFVVPWAGALVITATVVGVCLATRALLKRMAGRPVHPAAWWLTALPLLMLYNQYRYRLFGTVALVAALVAANLYARIAQGRARGRVGAFVILAALVFWLAGGMVVLFGVLCAAFEFLVNRRVAMGSLCLLIAPAAPVAVTWYSYEIPAAQAWMPLHPFGAIAPLSWLGLLTLMGAAHAGGLIYLVFISVVAGARPRPGFPGEWLRRRFRRSRDAGEETVTRRPVVVGAWRLRSFLVFVALLATATWLSFDVNCRRQLTLDYHAQRGAWDEVLRIARELHPDYYNPYVVHEVNRALYHSNRMPTELCRYIQYGGIPGIRVVRKRRNPTAYTKFAQLCFDLGHINAAQHWTHVALETEYREPEQLKLLVLINLIKGRPDTARTFLGALEKHLLYRGWVRDMRRRIERDPRTAGLEEVRRARDLMLTEDYGYGGFGGFSYEDALRQCLGSNRNNRMAFEYLMTCHLLTRQYRKIIDDLYLMDAFQYPGIPECYEEAILLYRAAYPKADVNLHGRRISRKTLSRRRMFFGDLMRYNSAGPGMKQARLDALIRDWGDSYFFYGTFGFSEPRPDWCVRRQAPKGVSP